MSVLTKTEFNFPGQTGVYHGKVRDVYSVGDRLVMVATDRISAFDVVLPKGIPFKGQMLNQIAAKFLDATTDICPNWKLSSPDPMVTVGLRCEGFAVEMIVRGYLCGSAWRAYKSGVREICGVRLPDGRWLIAFRDTDDSNSVTIFQIKIRKSQVNGDSSSLFFFPAVCISPCESLDQSCLTVIDMSRCTYDNILH